MKEEYASQTIHLKDIQYLILYRKFANPVVNH